MAKHKKHTRNRFDLKPRRRAVLNELQVREAPGLDDCGASCGQCDVCIADTDTPEAEPPNRPSWMTT